jgi:cytochrome P450
LLIAGHETTAMVMAWATIELSRCSALWERLCDEVEAAGVEPAMPPSSLADAKRLPLCEAVFREAVRLHGPAWFLERRVQEDVEYRGHRIPRGTTIAACPPLWGRDPALYPDPDAFEPDRWLGRKAPLSPVELSQFGSGAHFCLGYHLAWLESVQFLAALAASTRRRGARLRLESPGPVTSRTFPAPHPPKKTEIVFQT